MSGGSDQPGKDPRLEKARDSARQRKIVSNRSDKAARRHARTIKATANRHLRRKGRQDLSAMTDPDDLSGQDLATAHRAKDRHWGTQNAAAHRDRRNAERRYLDETPVGSLKGRARSLAQRLSNDRSPAELRAIAARLGATGLTAFPDQADALRRLADRLDQQSRDSLD